MTVAEALREAAQRLAAAGVDSAHLDAELLLRHVLGWERARLIASPEAMLPSSAASRYEALVALRASRRPLQHLTGRQAFWKHDFLVGPDVLIPRPETELLVETALELLADRPSPVIVDVGTGSGCIAISLALERPDASVWGLDVSAAALAVARDNAQRLGAAGRVRLAASNLLEAVGRLAGRVDLVVSNPPYLDPSEVGGLMPEVRDHEPRAALLPPGDRYEAYRRLAPQARAALAPQGAIAVEVGLGMAEEVGRILEAAGLHVQRVAKDLQDIPRVLAARV